MSEIKVNSIKGVGASAAAITVNNTDGTCTANITNKPNRNIIINGAFNIAQRGTSSTVAGYQTVDRFVASWSGQDEAPTQAQVDVASGTTPYTLGFRKAFGITNGNQSSGAGASDIVYIEHFIEAQDMANSGWNYTSSSSFITLSFWVKSSVSQDFKGYLRTVDGTNYHYAYSTGTLSANTWTKITKTIPGNSNLQFDNNNQQGLQLYLWPYIGTTYTDAGVTENAWGAYNSSQRTPVSATTWYTTNDATLEITGVQLEVGSVATDFEHRSFAQELQLCKRYYQKSYYYDIAPATASSFTDYINNRYGGSSVSNRIDLGTRFEVEMRSTPTMTIYRPDTGASGNLMVSATGTGVASGSGVGQGTIRGLGRKGFIGFSLENSHNESVGYHYQASAEL